MFVLPPLPYPTNALEPVLGDETLRTHHGKHHKKYVDTLNKLLAAEPEAPESLEAVIARSAAEGGKLFDNAGQAWNHGFFWECMTPERQEPPAEFAALREPFVKEGAGHFASGWVWIAARAGKLVVLSTHDADTLAHRTDLTPVLVCDVWEHAYYLDYKNDRKGFLERWFDEVANWRFAEAQQRAAQGQGMAWRYPRPTAEQGRLIGDQQAPQTAARPS
jgi:superoxide dismutase, Fe-Mn family